jgi:3-hydroxymyristoyl/3-hydroxydecanoyl-(acyl carrier protein) dehydratase
VSPSELTDLVQRCRRGPLHRGGPSAEPVHCRGAGLHRLLPHREPFLLIDEVTAVDRDARTIAGSRHVRGEDPVLAGHFPGDPVYPGVLLVEAMGQLGLCLAHFLAEAGAAPPGVRVVRILHAVFLEPVRPGDRLTLFAALIDDDGLTTSAAGQVCKGETLCALAVQEVYFVE